MSENCESPPRSKLLKPCKAHVVGAGCASENRVVRAMKFNREVRFVEDRAVWLTGGHAL